jgi:hypothetical protein
MQTIEPRMRGFICTASPRAGGIWAKPPLLAAIGTHAGSEAAARPVQPTGRSSNAGTGASHGISQWSSSKNANSAIRYTTE